MSTTQQVVRDFVANLKKYGHHDAIAMMGADDEEGDLFQAHIQKATRDLMQNFNSMYEKLENVWYPDIEPLSAFRKMWYLEKRERMRIPAPHRTQLPKAKSDSKETRARLYICGLGLC